MKRPYHSYVILTRMDGGWQGLNAAPRAPGYSIQLMPCIGEVYKSSDHTAYPIGKWFYYDITSGFNVHYDGVIRRVLRPEMVGYPVPMPRLRWWQKLWRKIRRK